MPDVKCSVRVAWWVTPWLDYLWICARVGMPIDVDMVGAIIANYGIVSEVE